MIIRDVLQIHSIERFKKRIFVLMTLGGCVELPPGTIISVLGLDEDNEEVWNVKTVQGEA